MPETTRWRKAMIFSVAIHCVLFLCAGYIMLREFLPPKEDLIEIALVSDFSFGADGGGGGGGSPEPADIKVPQISVPKIKVNDVPQRVEQKSEPTDTYTEEQTVEKPVESYQNFGTDESGSEDSAVQSGGGGGTGGGTGAGHGTGTGSGTGSGSGSGFGSGHGDGYGSGVGSGTGGAISPPGVLATVKPNYPGAARRNGIEGTVYLRVQVSEGGKAVDVSVAGSSGDASLDNAAVKAIYKWRFIPAKDRSGNSIACYTQIPVVFRLTDA